MLAACAKSSFTMSLNQNTVKSFPNGCVIQRAVPFSCHFKTLYLIKGNFQNGKHIFIFND